MLGRVGRWIKKRYRAFLSARGARYYSRAYDAWKSNPAARTRHPVRPLKDANPVSEPSFASRAQPTPYVPVHPPILAFKIKTLSETQTSVVSSIPYLILDKDSLVDPATLVYDPKGSSIYWTEGCIQLSSSDPR